MKETVFVRRTWMIAASLCAAIGGNLSDRAMAAQSDGGVSGTPSPDVFPKMLAAYIKDCIPKASKDYCTETTKEFAEISQFVKTLPNEKADENRTIAQIVKKFKADLPKEKGKEGETFGAIELNDMATGQGSGPSGQNIPSDGKSLIGFSAESDTKTASIKFDKDISDQFPPTKLFGSITTLSITAQTPIGQGANFQNIATLDGLVKATSIGFQLTRVGSFLTSSRLKQEGQYFDDYRHTSVYQTACKNFLMKLENMNIDAGTDDKYQAMTSGRLSCLSNDIVKIENNHPITDKNEEKKFLDALKVLDPSSINISGYGPIIGSAPLWMLSINGKVGYDQHVFYDGASLAKTVEYKAPFQIGASLTGVWATRIFGLPGDVSATLSFNHQETYQDGGLLGQTQTLCPTTGKVVLKCVNGYIGPPLFVEKDLVAGDLRWIATGKFPIGVNPTFTYDARSEIYAASLPIYIISNKNKTLSGGIRYDWTSDKHQSIVGIFVSSAFCVVPVDNLCGQSGSQSRQAGDDQTSPGPS